MGHQCRILPCTVTWLPLSKVTMTSVMMMTLTMMSLSATTTKMPGTIIAEGSCEAWCQRDCHPNTFPLIMCTISACSDTWPGLMGPVANARGHKISFPRAVPRDWWTICWHTCGGCRTRPIAWCQIPWTPAGLSLTPSPFTKAGRLYMGLWGPWGCWNRSEPHAFHHHRS